MSNWIWIRKFGGGCTQGQNRKTTRSEAPSLTSSDSMWKESARLFRHLHVTVVHARQSACAGFWRMMIFVWFIKAYAFLYVVDKHEYLWSLFITMTYVKAYDLYNFPPLNLHGITRCTLYRLYGLSPFSLWTSRANEQLFSVSKLSVDICSPKSITTYRICFFFFMSVIFPPLRHNCHIIWAGGCLRMG